MKRTTYAILFFTLLSTCTIKPSTLLYNGRIDYKNLSLEMTRIEIENILGQPDKKTNLMGWGYYHYKNLGVYFNDIVGYYENNKLKEIQNPESKINEIVFYDEYKVYDIKIGSSQVNDVYKIFGDPDLMKEITMDPDGESLLAGKYLIYFKNKYCLMISYDNQNIVNTIRMLLKTKFSN